MKYTEEDVKLLRQFSGEGREIDEICQIMGRSKASVISKMVVEGLYSKSTRGSKATGPSKTELIDEIAELADADVDLLEGLRKASKASLQYLAQRLRAELSE